MFDSLTRGRRSTSDQTDVSTTRFTISPVLLVVPVLSEVKRP
jgi:hypothetical protein